MPLSHPPTSTPARPPTRQRIVSTALELFARHGITETTTRQIADRAQINEVTLFRHFGNKHGLLLAVLQECLQKYLLLTQVGESLMIPEVSNQRDLTQLLRYYMQSSLQALESVPELMRSLVGEAGQYPVESRQALAQGIAQVNQSISNTLREVINNAHVDLPLPPLKLATLVNTCILGYAVICLTTDAQTVWSNQEEFISSLIETIAWHSDRSEQTKSSEPNEATMRTVYTEPVADLPTDTVHEIIQQAKRLGALDYAIAYTLFGSGLLPEEITSLRRDDYWIDGKAGILRVGTNSPHQRTVPINQKILGQRYGSAHNNPLTNYLKARKDEHINMFLSSDLQPLDVKQLERSWLQWTQWRRKLDGNPVDIYQARQTWGVEMLVRGMDAENFSIISGMKPPEIQHYQRRVKEKAAISQAIALDS
jgi:AcrR family transcriptional regulator